MDPKIIEIQRQLNLKGAKLVPTGVMDAATIAAMNSFSTQASSSSSSQMTPAQVMDLQRSLIAKGAKISPTGVLDADTIKAMNSAVATSVASHPDLAHLTANNSPEAIANAYLTGDWGGVTDITGKPFSDADQQAAVDKANSALAPGFKETQTYDTANTEDALGSKEDAYQQFLKTQGQNFTVDKNNQDQNAVDNGVLFSGSRFQKLNDLKSKYEDADAIKRASLSTDVGSTLRDYQYKYGNNAVGSLSQYYNAPGGNVYNPGVVRGGVTGGSIASIYDPSRYNFQGTATNANKAAVQTRAASLLANNANKLTSLGYKNQF